MVRSGVRFPSQPRCNSVWLLLFWGKGNTARAREIRPERAVFLLWSKPLKHKPLFSNRAGESLGLC